MAAFILGLLLGGIVGMFTMGLCITARDEDDREDRIHEQERS